MTIDYITIKDFEDTFQVLLRMKNDMSQTYDALKEAIKISKENKIPLIGNPLIEMQNNLIEMSYLLTLHDLNCKVYQELIADNVELDKHFVEQLKWLLEMTKEISIKYDFLKERLIEIPMYSDRLQPVI